MSTKLKTALTIDDSAIINGATIDDIDFNVPFGEVETELKAGRTSVSDADTHIKHLEDAITGVSGQFAITKQNNAGNESLQLNLDATGITSGYVATANGSNGWSWAASGGGGAAPVDVTGTAGENLALRDYVYLNESAGTWWKVDTDSSPVRCGKIRGIVNNAAITSGNTGSIRLLGEISGYTGLTAWSPVYASTTAGGYTQTRPSPTSGGAQVAVIEIGVAVSATSIVLLPPRGILYMKRNSVAANGTLTIEHHADAMGHTRTAKAYIGSSEAGATITEYLSSNQDTDINLETTGLGSPATTTIAAGTATSAVVGNTSDQWLAQGFQVTAGQFTQFKIYFSVSFGSPTGTMTWELRTNSGGVPSTTILASGTFTPADSSLNTINVTSGPTLSAATTYHMVLRSTTPQGAARGWQLYQSTSSVYASGSVSIYTGSWASSASNDLNSEFTTQEVVVGNEKLAQTFTLASTTSVASLTMYLKKIGSPTGTLTARIETVSGGNPTGTLAHASASATMTESSLTTSYATYTFTFTSFSLAAGDYAIVLDTDRTASATNYVAWGADTSTSSYSGGIGSKFDGATWAAISGDFIFGLTSPGTTFVEPAVCGRWSGGTRDIAIRYDDGTGTDGNTKTTGKNVIGATADITLVLEIP